MSTVHLLRVGYVLAFGLAGVACLASVPSARRIEAPGTRVGLVGLLATSGVWALALAGQVVAPTATVAAAAHVVGLSVGLAAVGAWLYFASAYAGRDHHRRPAVRRAAAATYLLIVGVKLTNPIHGAYFAVRAVATPFPYFVVERTLLHWCVAGLAYALAAVGAYVLLEAITAAADDSRSTRGTTAVSTLVGLAVVPVAFTLFTFADASVLIPLDYEPLGVAAFAVGSQFVFRDSFLAVRRRGRERAIDHLSDAVVVLDDDGAVRDANAAAERAFPALVGAVGDPVRAVAPSLAAAVDERSGEVVRFDVDGDVRYYLIRDDAVDAGVGDRTLGRTVTCTDVTRSEERRRELARQNDQLADFGAAVTHELRNPLNVIIGRAALAADDLDAATDDPDAATDGGPDARESAREALDVITRTGWEMAAVVDDLRTIASQAQTIDDVTPCSVPEAARRAFARVAADGDAAAGDGTDHAGVTLSVDDEAGGDGRVLADRERLDGLLTYVLGYACREGTTTVTVTVRADGFDVVDDGPAPDPAAVDSFGAVVEYGEAADDGIGLANARMLARVHGWSVRVRATGTGVRFAVDGVRRPSDVE